jgi:hypothetical protein
VRECFPGIEAEESESLLFSFVCTTVGLPFKESVCPSRAILTFAFVAARWPHRRKAKILKRRKDIIIVRVIALEN